MSTEREKLKEKLRTGKIISVEPLTDQGQTKLKDTEHAKRSEVYRYEPVFFDRINGPANRPDLASGDLVVKVQPPGCPKNGTMGICYIGDKDTGELLGWVMEASLIPVKR
jgi:hypothetical protein